MEAVHELVEPIEFAGGGLLVTVTIKGGVVIHIAWKDWGSDQKRTTVIKFMNG